MLEIKNLSQLKRAVKEKRIFIIKRHYIKPEYTGQRRKPNVVQTNGFYSIVPDAPEHTVTLANDGKGFWFPYGKASEWKFENSICKYASHGKEIWEIQFE